MQQYEIAIIAEIGGGVLVVVGFLASLYGIVAEPVEPTPAKPPIVYERHGLTWIRKHVETPKREGPVPQETKDVIQCPFCGEELRSHTIYCLKCGKKVE